MELHEMTAVQAAEAIKQKKLKARELTEAVLSRLESTDSRIKAFVTVTADLALQQADAIDRKLLHNEPLPPLAGIPVAFRDDICVEGFPAASGSRSLEKFPAPYSAAVVEKMNEAGGITVGKTNLDEFGMGNTTETSSFQVTRNPSDTGLTAGDGSAAAVACGQTFIGVGSDTGGALRVSASYCGIAGLRPTPGLVSRYGLISFASSMSQVGFHARKAGDFTLLFDVVSGYDPRDSSTVDFSNMSTGKIEGRKLKIGFPGEIFGKLEGAAGALPGEIRRVISSSGYEPEDISLPHFSYGLQAYYIIAIAESFSNLSRYDGIRYGYHSGEDSLDGWYHKTRKNGLGEEARRRSVLGAYLLSTGNYEKYYEKALQVWSLVKDDFDRALRDCDFLILPAAGTGAYDLRNKREFTENYRDDEYCAPVSLAGMPSLTLPVLNGDGLPLGVQLIGPRYSDSMLINVGEHLEKEINYSAPNFL